MKKIAIYARVSKRLEQTPENQLIALRDYVSRNNDKYILMGEYIDEASSRDTRPNKEILLKKIRNKEIDGVAVVALDRWGRTMSELILELEEFSKTGKILISLKEGIDLDTAPGRFMANILASFANFERDRISERTRLGLARARALGKTWGRRGKDKGPRRKSGYWLRWSKQRETVKNNEFSI